MPRQPKLRRKNGHWYTRTGSASGQYFGKIADIPFKEAQQRFADFLKSLQTATTGRGITVVALCDLFLDWVKLHRGDRTYDERKRHLERFCNFKVGTQALGTLVATDIQASDLLAFLDYLKDQKVNGEDGLDESVVGDFTADKYATSVKAAFNWATKHPSPVTYLPASFRPFSSVEKYKRPEEPLTADELPTNDEIAALLHFADADLEPVGHGKNRRQRRPDEYRMGDANPYQGFKDMLCCYYNTGARTSELASWRVRNFIRASNQIVLGKHKQSKTMKAPAPRRIAINDAILPIILRHCEGKGPNDFIFTDPKGKSWNRWTLDNRFKQVRERAGVREEITIYSFRHLWISEMVMEGVDVATTAKMAGTSIAMIEKVYGHFSGDHFHQAQSQLDAARNLRRMSA